MNLYYFGHMLNMASVFMTAGTGAAISMRCGEFNLGGEGQIYAGGFVCALVLAQLKGFPPVIAVSLSLLSGVLVSALLCFISALLKKFKNASFLLTSFIISSAIIPLINGLIAGPCRGNTGNLLATPFIQKSFRFAQIMKPSNLNPTFFIGFLICGLGALLLFKTNFGRKLCVYGISNEFANYSGFSEKSIVFTSALISGGLHGLAGGFLICGTYFTCHSGFYAGLGWSSLSASMLGLSNPLLVIPSSLFLGFVNMLTTKISLRHNVGFDLGSLIQSIIMFLISIPFYTNIKRLPRYARNDKRTAYCNDKKTTYCNDKRTTYCNDRRTLFNTKRKTLFNTERKSLFSNDKRAQKVMSLRGAKRRGNPEKKGDNL